MKERLREAEIDFNEVIISFDAPAEKAKNVQKKTSLMGRLFGSD